MTDAADLTIVDATRILVANRRVPSIYLPPRPSSPRVQPGSLRSCCRCC